MEGGLVWEGIHWVTLCAAIVQTEAFLEMLGLPYNLDHGTNAQHGSSAASAGMPTADALLTCLPEATPRLSGWHGSIDV